MQTPLKIKKALRMLITLIGLYVLLCAVSCTFQRKLIYFPSKLNDGLAGIMAAREGFQPWKNEAGEIVGWKLPSRTSPTGSVLVVHGNAGSAVDRGYFAKPIHAASSVDVFILEYPGYGARSGSPSLKLFLAAADEAFVLLDQSKPIYIVSESIGTGVAAHLAKTLSSDVAGLVLFAPFTNFKTVVQKNMPFLPVSLILLDRYDPEEWLKSYSGPVKFIVAENDEIIPAKLGLKLHDEFGGPKNLEIIPGARHNDVAAQSVDWWQSVFSFWQTNAR